MGFTTIFLRFGSMGFSPPAGNSLAAGGASAPFVFWSILAVLGLVCFSLVREQGAEPATTEAEAKLSKVS